MSLKQDVEVLQEALNNLAGLGVLIQRVDDAYIKAITDPRAQERMRKKLPYNWGTHYDTLSINGYASDEITLLGQYNDACNCHPEMQTSELTLPITYAFLEPDTELPNFRRAYLRGLLDRILLDLEKEDREAIRQADLKAVAEAQLTKEFGPSK